MSYQRYETRRLATTLAACVLAALAACSKEIGNNAQAKPGVGQKLDQAIERTEQKLSNAGERAKEGVAEATEKTQEALSKAGDKIQGAASNTAAEVKHSAQSSPPPYAPRQPMQGSVTVPTPTVTDGTVGTTTEPNTSTTTLSSGPATSIKMSGVSVSPQTRARLDDAVITASVKAGLVKDPDLSALKIDVDTRDGVVTLNGLAGNEPAKQRAAKMAQSVKGVREVKNYLTIKQG